MSALADLRLLLSYPGPGFRDAALAAARRLSDADPAAAEALVEFRAFVAARLDTELEESYTQTFDLDPKRALEVGWHLYGEEYKRGEFLVEMRARLRRLGIEEGPELPDHLVGVLAAIEKADAAESAALAREKVLPALAKMRAAAAGSPYEGVLRAAEIVLEGRLGAAAGPEGRAAGPEGRAAGGDER